VIESNSHVGMSREFLWSLEVKDIEGGVLPVELSTIFRALWQGCYRMAG